MSSLDLRGKLGDARKLPRLSPRLEHLDVSHNRLEVLDLSTKPKSLYTVRANDNRLTSVDVRGCFDLEVLDVRNNKLRTLDVTGLIRVDELKVSGNPLAKLIATDLLLVVHPQLRRAAKKIVTRPATAHEIHYACDKHNWDDGDKLLRWAVKQPQCDPATALLIYFRAQPGFYLGRRNLDADEQRVKRWLESIEARLVRGDFNPVSVAYDPQKDVGRDATYWKGVNPALNVRAKPVKGSPRYPFTR